MPQPEPTTTADAKQWNFWLWFLQVGLALLFAATALEKLGTQYTELVWKLPWVHHFPPIVVTLLGVIEGVAAIGLVLPAAIRVQPVLTLFTALGLTLEMLGALVTNLVIHDTGMATVTTMVLAGTAVVTWGRYAKAPVLPR